MYDLIIVGGGAAGVFAAICAKKTKSNAKVLILEKTSKLLFKVEISGGGRCNVTNAIFDPKELTKFYPRGQKELLSAFYQFQPKDMIEWLESKGVKLTKDSEGKIFSASNRSETILNCLINEAKKIGVDIYLNQNIKSILKKEDGFEVVLKNLASLHSKKLLLATGSQKEGYEFAEKLGHTINTPIPSLFSFKIKKSPILKLSGISQKPVEIKIQNTKFSQVGSLLITHEGFSGPAIINLSAYAARFLYENNYKANLVINWLYDKSKIEIEKFLIDLKKNQGKKFLVNLKIFDFSKSLWEYFLDSFHERFKKPIKDISDKDFKILTEKLFSDVFEIIGKSTNKQEFVTCGGVDLKEVNFKNMESKICKNLYFAGEILDVDGITGGFNFQNAWTTGFIAGSNIV
ncbi:MAG: NAD(P)/FAD-dependent oxidoreductase [Parachlamydiales bacterium]|nr:NAD(P)/FAD-dependent oxidoreductase [Parachlamydiales bacterium]